MDRPRDRPSGIPRLSRLPVPRSSIPQPALATSTTPSLRSRPSRDGFGGGELNPPKLRTAASREFRRSGIGSINSLGGRESPLKTAPSREQLRSNEQHTVTEKTRVQPRSTPRRTSVQSLQKQFDATTTNPEAELATGSDLFEDDVLNQSHTQSRPSRSPELLPLDTLGITDGVDDTGAEAHHDNVAAFRTPSARKMQPRPSLSERTMETLAQIPSSPALTKRPSSFFDQGRPRSRAEGGSSRPGSSYNSDGTGRASSRQGSRPGSSAGQDAPSTPSLRASSMSFKTNLSTISATPRRTSAIGLAKTPLTKATPSRTSLTSAFNLAASDIPPVLDIAPSPSTNRAAFGGTPLKSGSKTITGPSLKSRKSTQGLFKKRSLPAMKEFAGSTDSMHVLGTTWDGSVPPPTSSAESSAVQSAALTSRKSSAALREHIAKAKAAKRAVARQPSNSQEFITSDDRPVVSNDELEPGIEHDDPFNLRKGEKPGTKVLQQRVASARTTGRLNIAALGLKDIPPEVMKMYDSESVSGHGGNWAESVDLTRLVAADNEIEEFGDDVFPDKSLGAFVDDDDDDDDESQSNIFGGLETLDLHGNLLSTVPLGFRRLAHLTSLNLSSNKLENKSLETISQITSLRDLKLSKNQLSGTLDPVLLNLHALEMIDVHGNNISALPAGMETMSRLRILNLNENKLEMIAFDSLCKLPLTELLIRKNRLSGVLIQQPIEGLPLLQTLDASANQLTHLVPHESKISLPAIHSISLSVNRLQCLPDMTGWTSLLRLSLDENHIASIPESFTTLQKLRHADFASNDIRAVPPEIARMQGLTMIRLTGNPLRDRKLISASTDELKDMLAARLEPPPPYQEPNDQSTMAGFVGDGSAIDSKLRHAPGTSSMVLHDDDPRSDVEDDFTTPPTSAPHTPTRSRSQTVVKDMWYVKPGGLLDLSRSEMSSLNPQTSSAVASQNQVRQIQLHHNPVAVIPMSLAAFESTLSLLSLAHTQLAGESYLTETLELPALRELSIMSNQVTGLGALTRLLKAPALEKIDATLNRITALPTDLKQAFPQLSVLLVPSNRLSELDADSIRGLKIVDASSNDIGQLNPRLGLLGGVDGGLQRLEVTGNRFKVPRWSILERGTEAILRWLRARLPAEEMAAWKAANGEESGDDVD
ncbi:hypothetical protein EsDP_00002391 [Epichloe bromicola]|uniref:Leucine-rich repeat-containing protein 40 n=1 Tax=Epichloe bromicola TaxID=79588 RepID=A0ABQ0CKN3_9HYPO